jgi:hypothetical protein
MHQPGEMLSRIWRASVDASMPKLGEFLGDPQLAGKICEAAKLEEGGSSTHVYFKMYIPSFVDVWR